MAFVIPPNVLVVMKAINEIMKITDPKITLSFLADGVVIQQ